MTFIRILFKLIQNSIFSILTGGTSSTSSATSPLMTPVNGVPPRLTPDLTTGLTPNEPQQRGPQPSTSRGVNSSNRFGNNNNLDITLLSLADNMQRICRDSLADCTASRYVMYLFLTVILQNAFMFCTWPFYDMVFHKWALFVSGQKKLAGWLC